MGYVHASHFSIAGELPTLVPEAGIRKTSFCKLLDFALKMSPFQLTLVSFKARHSRE